MISILSKTPSQIISDTTSGPSSPCKVGSPSIDFLDLIVKPNLSTASSLSTNDNFSVRADDEISKSPLDNFDIKMPTKRAPKAPKKKAPTEPLSLQEIATKRPYVKSNKYSKKNKEQPPAPESCNKKRYIIFDLNESLEVLTKKEKLNDNTERCLISNSNTDSAVNAPLVVLKDGKVEISPINAPVEEKTINKELEVVSNKKNKVTTSSSFKNPTHTKKWTEKETKKFYRALELFGTDFSMIAQLFPTRNRNQMKHKFLREEKQNPEKVNAIFKNIKTISFSGLMNRYQRKAVKMSQSANAINTSVRKSSSTNINVDGNAIEGPTFEFPIVRQERSGSFNSVISLASVDMEIMEDLAEAFVPTKIVNLF